MSSPTPPLAIILGLLAAQTKNLTRAPNFAEELATPQTMSRATYASLTVLLIDNQTRELLGWEPIFLTVEVRAELKALVRAAEFIWVNGSGVVKKRPLDENAQSKESRPAHSKNENGKPEGKRPEKKKKIEPPAEAPVVSLVDKIIRALNAMPDFTDAARRTNDRSCRNVKVMAKNTAEGLVKLKTILKAEKTPHAIDTMMMISGIDRLIDQSDWAYSSDGLSIVSKL